MFSLKCLFQFEISCVKNDMQCTSEKIIMAKVGGHESEHDVFHDVNSILYKKDLTKSYQCFPLWKL